MKPMGKGWTYLRLLTASVRGGERAGVSTEGTFVLFPSESGREGKGEVLNNPPEFAVEEDQAFFQLPLPGLRIL